MLHQRHQPSQRSVGTASTGRGRSRAVLAVPAAALAVVSLAGCGGGGSKAAVAATTAAGGSRTGTSAGSSRAPGAGFAAYAACLTKNGVTLPTGRPGGFARPSGSARPTARPGGGARGAFGLDTADPKTAAAVKACSALRPTGGFGAGPDSAALQSQLTAYRSCLSDHGVTLPTPPAGATDRPGGRAGGPGGLGALDTADPKTAAAVKACGPLRPTFAPRSGAPAPTVTPST